MTVTHSSFTVERSYSHSAARVFALLADPARKRRWFAEGDQHEVLSYASEFTPGGVERLSYRFTGDSPVRDLILVQEGRFEAIETDTRVVTSGSMTLAGAWMSSSLVTMELFPEGDGTRLRCTFQGVFAERSDGPAMREAGWNVMLEKIGEML